MDKTRIEWANATWNPVRGCSRISPGCGGSDVGGCYAERMAHRFSGRGRPYEGLTRQTKHGPRWTGEVRCHAEVLDQPLRWKKPRLIFVCSMGDLFHHRVSDAFVAKVFAVMAEAHWHTFQVLTKRPARMREWSASVMHYPRGDREQRPVRGWPPNVWVGVSVEDQERANERIPSLLETPAAVRWVSCEPLLGPVDLLHIKPWHPVHGPDGADALGGGSWGHAFVRQMAGDPTSPGYCGHSDAPRLDWVVAGCESGPGRRPMHLDWARSLRDQCVQSGVPFFLKQADEPCRRCGGAEAVCPMCGGSPGPLVKMPELDGEVWDQMPGGLARGKS